GIAVSMTADRPRFLSECNRPWGQKATLLSLKQWFPIYPCDVQLSDMELSRTLFAGLVTTGAVAYALYRWRTVDSDTDQAANPVAHAD
ncbi:MAG: hypothetical protein V5A39_15145, partial [Haloarculaceae archaeon]